MELEGENDILLTKLKVSLEKSTNTLHKKALIFVRSLHENFGSKKLTGIEGLKLYTKSIIDFLIAFQKNNDFSDEEILNYEALIFTLAVCLKQLPQEILRGQALFEKIEKIVKFSLSSEDLSNNCVILKYFMKILENFILSRTNEELQNQKDPIVAFFIEHYFIIMLSTIKNATSLNQNFQNLVKDIIKTTCKIISLKTNYIKFTILKSIIDFIKLKLSQMSHSSSENVNKDNEGPSVVSSISQNEAEYVLKYLSSIIQFLPFDVVNDLIVELYSLIEQITNKNVLMNSFLCIDMAFSTKTFTLETCEKFLALLMNKNVLLSDAVSTNVNSDFKDKFIVAYIKSISQVLISTNTLNQIESLKFFIGFLQLAQELLVDNNEFVKGSLFNALQNLINKLMAKENLDKLFSTPKDDISIENITLNNDDTKYNGDFLLEKIAQSLLYCLSSRYTDNRIGYNLLLLFIEKINLCVHKQNISKINDFVIQNLGEKEVKSNKKSEMMKIFIGKALNFIPCSVITHYFPLGILDFDIDTEDYTDSSNVWLISYMDKFLKDNSSQNLQDYVSQFMELINNLEYVIQKNINAKIAAKDEMLVDENEENDERFLIDYNDTKYIRGVKVKRYKLILTQLMTQILKFTNYCPNYDQYISAFLDKFEKYYEKGAECYFDNLKEITFKFLYKVLIISIKVKDPKSIEVLRTKGSFFFQKILNLILSSKVNKNELQEGFNVITKFCLILNESFLLKIICDMVEKFNSAYDLNDKTIYSKEKEKEVKKLQMRLEIINFIFKTMNYEIQNPESSTNQIINSENKEQKEKVTSLLLDFYEKYYFQCAAQSNFGMQNIAKRLFDIYINILYKIKDLDYAYFIYSSKFKDKNGLNLISSKQKCKVFEYIISIIMKKFNLICKSNTNISFEQLQTHFAILSDIALLTKDINRKSRNEAYEILGNLTKFFTEKNLFIQWINMVVATLLKSSNSLFISAGINCLARIYWENRNESFILENIFENCKVVLDLFETSNKEIIKSLFIYVRVLLYITKVNAKNINVSDETINVIINKVLYSSLILLKENFQKEFKVKIRNLLKNLIINFGFEKIKNSTNEKFFSLLGYVNKHIVKKAKGISNEEEILHGYNAKDLDDTVMMDNEENLIDEEEDYIKKEFKKIEKKVEDKDKKIIKKIEDLNIYDDDIELVREKEKEQIEKNEKAQKADAKIDKIEELFVKDNVELNNFFYVNPFVQSDKGNDAKGDADKENKEKDVIYDSKKGKIIVKDLEKEIQESKLAKKRKKEAILNNTNDIPIEKGKNVNFLMKKRVQNVRNDNDDFDAGSDEENGKSKRKKMKTNEGIEKNKGKPMGHYVKYSGDEYKNKRAKGDKILQGKYEPFAYIQLNPKAVSNKGKKANLKVFEEIMKNDNKK